MKRTCKSFQLAAHNARVTAVAARILGICFVTNKCSANTTSVYRAAMQRASADERNPQFCAQE